MKKTIKFVEGKQKCKPQLNFNSRKNYGIEGTIQLTEDFLYELKNPTQPNDQEDWIKLTGIHFIRYFWDAFWPNKNGNMIAFRNSKKYRGPQVCIYTNRGFERQTYYEVNMIDLTSPIEFGIYKDNCWFKLEGEVYEQSGLLVPKHNKIKYTNSYFGGTSKPEEDKQFDLYWHWKERK